QRALQRDAAGTNRQRRRVRFKPRSINSYVDSARRQIIHQRLTRSIRSNTHRARPHRRTRNHSTGRIANEHTKTARLSQSRGGEKHPDGCLHFLNFSGLIFGLSFAFFSSNSSTSAPSDESTVSFGSISEP